MRPEDQFTFAGVILVTGLVIFMTALPLIYRKIPMNYFYGIRLREAFRSTERWYEINEYGGRLLARWSVPIILAGAIAFAVPPRFLFGYAVATVVVILVSIFVPLIQIVRWIKRAPKTAGD